MLFSGPKSLLQVQLALPERWLHSLQAYCLLQARLRCTLAEHLRPPTSKSFAAAEALIDMLMQSQDHLDLSLATKQESAIVTDLKLRLPTTDSIGALQD